MSAITSSAGQKIKTHIIPAVCIALVGVMLAFGDKLDDALYKFLTQFYSVPQASFLLTCSISVLIAVLPLLFFNVLKRFNAATVISAYLSIVLLFFAGTILLFDIWLSPVKALLAVLIAYLLWLTLITKAAQNSIDDVLQNMRNELSQLGMEPVEELAETIAASSQSRIARLMLTMQHLRDLHKSRNDALMFISHDIRTPLGAAIQLLDKFEQTKYTQRMQQLLERANMMAEGFIHASRAESADVNKFAAIDIENLCQQVVDDLYELINAKDLIVSKNFPGESVLVRGDYGLLYRAVSNILLNAVNYSPKNGKLQLLLSADDKNLQLKIVDEGPGIPESKLPQLFKRFSRVEDEYNSANGSGLGLYFVNITVKKHRGNVSVRNLDGCGAEFLITLPLERRKVNLNVPYERRSDMSVALGDTV